MRVAPRVLFLVRDAAGYGAALADALRPRPGLTRESSPFELPLGKYGLDGEKASGELLSFSDSSGSPQVRAQEDFYLSHLFDSIRVLPVKM
ncbi:unnamed protein product [Miscanthus lutarioriparius]|uniref:DUF7894 domain-containing protein n=1 Tax=Miscanthus lutarioriparius TaxID=422564 RepID=A0A811Q3N4_9POAL|nr:unnamed protein product [Miscanthus lutarioriparius]